MTFFQHEDGRLRYQALDTLYYFCVSFDLAVSKMETEPELTKEDLTLELAEKFKQLAEEYKQGLPDSEQNKYYTENLKPSKFKSLQMALWTIIEELGDRQRSIKLRNKLGERMNRHPFKLIMPKKEGHNPHRKEELELLADDQLQQELKAERKEKETELESALKYYEIEDRVPFDKVKQKMIHCQDKGDLEEIRGEVVEAMGGEANEDVVKVLQLLTEYFVICPQDRLYQLSIQMKTLAEERGSKRVQDKYNRELTQFKNNRELPGEELIEAVQQFVAQRAQTELARLLEGFSVQEDILNQPPFDPDKLQEHYDNTIELILEANPELTKLELNTAHRWLLAVLNYHKIETKTGRVSTLLVENIMTGMFDTKGEKPKDIAVFYQNIFSALQLIERYFDKLLRDEKKRVEENDFFDFSAPKRHKERIGLESMSCHFLDLYLRAAPKHAYKQKPSQLALGAIRAVSEFMRVVGDLRFLEASSHDEFILEESSWDGTGLDRLKTKIVRAAVYNCRDIEDLLLDGKKLDQGWKDQVLDRFPK